MAEHGLTAAGWTLEWGNAKRSLGQAIESRTDRRTGRTEPVRVIRLSRVLMRLNTEAEVRDTVLHEIAHALVGAKHGHGPVWKAKCREIGANPVRCAGPGVAVPEAPWVVDCGVCGTRLFTRHRRPRKDFMARVGCRACGPRSFGRAVLKPCARGTPAAVEPPAPVEQPAEVEAPQMLF